mmetsp:Transcript_35921/g.96263  ORF Transcript_35921/g.96263 Transcript_35921/m.96263 type:complete len:184 (-) Transcript_35921:60-611(-)
MSQAFSRERQSVIDSELRHGMRQPTPQWAMASPSGRAVRAVRAIQAPPPAPLPAHQEHYDTEPDSDQGDGNETEGYDMMMDMPDQQGLPTPIANAAAPNEGAAPSVVATPPPNPAPPAQGEAAEEDLGMRVLQLESQLAQALLTLARAQREIADRDAAERRRRREARLLQSAAAGRHWSTRRI